MNNRLYIRLLKNLGVKAGIRVLLKLGVGFGKKIAIKIATSPLLIFPIIGELINGVIGNLIDLPTFNRDFNEAKNEFLQKLKSSPNMAVRRIIQDYNDAINYFGKRANININQDYYIIPGNEIYNNNINNIIEEFNNLNLNELLIDDDQENNNV
jgi:hypothetical protein